jgi:Cu/Ag efflux pump CusA
MRQLGAVVLAAVAASAPARGGAEEPPLTLQSALDLAIANDLDLAAARRGRAVREAEVKTAGLLPLALGLGSGAELQKPLAIAVIGGLSVSTVVTLVFVPTILSTLHERRQAEAGGEPA